MAMTSSIRRWLDDHVNLERDGRGELVPAAPTLERIGQLVDLLGDPHRAYPVVHVTGTNGKSSTARMVAALLAARGLSVGLFTSPHLQSLNERLSWNLAPIDDEGLDEVLDTIRSVEGMMDGRPSYFEVVTAAAFAWFADVAVDAAVIEVGLGGTWDATNVVEGDVAVVTNVAVDHVEYLGPDRQSIAKEKAGIVKDGCRLVLGETDPELMPVFTGAARTDRVYRRDEDFGVSSNEMAHGGRLIELWSPGGVHPPLLLPLHGAHQADNAAAAVTAAEVFFGDDPLGEAVLAEAFTGLELPGRLEVVGRHPLLLLDGAHNPDGARSLVAALDEEFPGEARTLVVGLLREKEPHEMLEAMGAADADRIVACRPSSPRALDPEVVASAARNVGVPSVMVEVVDTVAEGVAKALATTPAHGQVVVTGSLYTVGAAREAILGV